MEFFQAIANMSGDSLAQHLANGISLGSLYALIAIGYTMVYGILLMINFAHGDIVMMACYFAFFGITVFHIPWYITFVGVIIATAILGVVIERTAYRPLRDAPKNSVLISAIGASFLLENLANYLFSGRPMRFPNIELLSQNISIGGIQIQAICLVIPVITIISLVVLLHIVNHTKTGMAMRAVSKDYEIARVMGVDIDKIISITFGRYWRYYVGYPLSWHYPDDGGYAGFEMLYCGGYRRHRQYQGCSAGRLYTRPGRDPDSCFFPAAFRLPRCLCFYRAYCDSVL